MTQCYPPALGGIEGLMGGLARELAALGRPVRVLADGAAPGRDEGAPAIERFTGPRPLRRLAKAWRIRALLSAGGVEGIYADSWKSLETLRLLWRRKPGCRVACFAHGNEYPPDATPRKRRRIRAALAVADVIVANSGFTADRVAAVIGPDPRIRRRVLPIDAPVEPDAADTRFAAEIWPGPGPRLLTLARLEPLKGVDAVIRALPDLARRFPGVVHVVAGTGDDAPRLRALAAEVGVSDRVVFAGRVEGGRKTALYRAADLFVLPNRVVGNRQEGYGLVFAEAGLQGLPAVAGRSGGVADAVADGETGLLVDGASQAAVTAAIAELLADPARRAAMAAAARTRAEAATWPRLRESYLRDLTG